MILSSMSKGEKTMQKMMEKMESVLAPLATKIGSNKILKAISTAFNLIMPVIILGAIFTLLSTLSIGGYQDFLASSGIGQVLALVGRFTTDMLAVYVAFTAAYAFVRNEGMNADAVPAGLLSILAFFIMTPLANIVVNETPTTFISFDYLGSKGLFTALIVGVLVGFIYTFVVNRGWVIKMPEGVPPTVAKSFSALIPGFVVTAIFLIINGAFAAMVGQTFSEWFYGIIAAPLSALSGSLVTFMILMLLASVFWFFGIHGGQVTIPFLMMIFMQAGVENQTAFASGGEMQNIITVGLLFFLMLGGIGHTIGLSIDMLFAKSNRYKTLGKLAILPSCCGINEPIVFGLPLILNPIMALPYFIVPQINILITYFAMSSGLVSLPRIAMGAVGTPILLDGWLICGLSGVVLEIILIALSALLYYPFFKMQDNLAVKEEQALDS
jgi:PTS system cellobiose-specific IIC component